MTQLLGALCVAALAGTLASVAAGYIKRGLARMKRGRRKATVVEIDVDIR